MLQSSKRTFICFRQRSVPSRPYVTALPEELAPSDSEAHSAQSQLLRAHITTASAFSSSSASIKQCQHLHVSYCIILCEQRTGDSTPSSKLEALCLPI
jgi:hypothetical protein